MKAKQPPISEALIGNGIRLSKDGEVISLSVDDTHVTSYASDLTNQQVIIDDLRDLGIEVDPQVLQRIMLGQITEADAKYYPPIVSKFKKETSVKLRALRENAARRVLAKFPNLRLIGENNDDLIDDDGLEADQFYVLVVPNGSDSTEVTFHDGELCIGPFDTPLDAAIAVGSEDGDVNVVDGEGNPVTELDVPSTELAPPIAQLEPSDPTRLGEKTKMKRASLRSPTKSIREQVIKDINRFLENDDKLDIDTSIGFNKDGSTEGQSGNYSGNGAPDAGTQSPQDAGGSTALDTEADRRPEVRANPEGGVPLLNDPIKGGLDTNDQDLSDLGDGKGAVSESVNGMKRGSYVVVTDKTGKRVDSGLVESVSAKNITLEGCSYSYNFNEFVVTRTR